MGVPAWSRWREDPFLVRVYRRSRSESSVRFYWSGLRRFERFVAERLRLSPEGLAAQLRDGGDPYGVLDLFAEWCVAQGLKGKTVQDYLAAAKKWLRYHGVRLSSEELRERVETPQAEEPLDIAPTREQIRVILWGLPDRPAPGLTPRQQALRFRSASPRLQALILLMATSGMRLREALLLKVRDIEFDCDPPLVHLPASYTKNRKARETFITPEAKEVVLKALGRKARMLDEPLLGFNQESIYLAEKAASKMFRARMRLFPEWDQKAGDSRVHQLHLYSFRKFFFSQAVPIIGEHAAHALMGHGFYMKTYYRRPREKRAEDYRRLIPHLTIGEAHQVKQQLQQALEEKDQLINRLATTLLTIQQDFQKYKEKVDRLLGGT
jgi:integrase